MTHTAWPDARPEWDDLTLDERDEERAKGSASEFFEHPEFYDFAPSAYYEVYDGPDTLAEARGDA